MDFQAAPTPKEVTVCERVSEEMVVMLDGWYQARFNGQIISAGPGEVVLFRRGIQRGERTDPSRLMRSVNHYFLWPVPENLPCIVQDQQGLIRALSKALLTVSHAPPSSREGIRQGLMIGLLAEYIRLSSPQVDKVVRQTWEHIRVRMAKPITVGYLAARVGLSPKHYIRKFKALTGHTPMTAVRQARVEQARELISGSDLTLKEIAPRVGLATANHLSRLLRECLHTGVRSLRCHAPGE